MEFIYEELGSVCSTGYLVLHTQYSLEPNIPIPYYFSCSFCGLGLLRHPREEVLCLDLRVYSEFMEIRIIFATSERLV